MRPTSELAALDPAELYERDFYAWARQQAREVRRLPRLRSKHRSTSPISPRRSRIWVTRFETPS